MRRNKREIILDFTSLLDVIMIILFYFIIFAHLDSQNAIAEAENVKKEYELLTEDIQSEIDKTAEAYAQAEKLLDEISLADEQKSANIKGIEEFNQGVSLKIMLAVNSSDDWKLTIYCGDEVVSEIVCDEIDTMSQNLNDTITAMGYGTGDTILCNLFFYSDAAGSYKAYSQTKKLLDSLKEEYTHFFCSETDLSIFQEDIT